MATVADPTGENPTFLVVAASFVLLVAVAWFPLPGVAIALAWFGAALVSAHLYRLWRSSGSRTERWAALGGLAVTWLVVLVYAAMALPSNLSRAVI